MFLWLTKETSFHEGLGSLIKGSSRRASVIFQSINENWRTSAYRGRVFKDITCNVWTGVAIIWIFGFSFCDSAKDWKTRLGLFREGFPSKTSRGVSYDERDIGFELRWLARLAEVMINVRQISI